MDAKTNINIIPLCVDLDGTLVSTDTLWEGLTTLVMRRPYMVFHVFMWMLAGKAHLKQMVAEYSDHCATDWPVRPEVVSYIKRAKAQGRLVYLVTGAAQKTAEDVAAHLGLFDGIFHSTDKTNLTSVRKRDRLVKEFGEGGFDYIGNSRDDLAVFDYSRKAIVVAPDAAARNWQMQHQGEEISVKEPSKLAIFKAIRVHQWLKNVLIFVPLFLTHEHVNIEAVTIGIVAFFSFSFFASSVYLINDLSDLKADRAHAKKRFRPLAHCDISIPVALTTWFALVFASAALAVSLGWKFLLVLAIYGVITTAYTFLLKRKLLVDVFTLAGLYTLRIIAGAAAMSIALSFWLLAFSIFFFLSLALVKRYVEVSEIESGEDGFVMGRGYLGVDSAMLGQGGVASAFTSAMVLSLYINSTEIVDNYANPWMFWPLVPLILYMQLRIWILARRGHVHEDPVVFIMRDWRSQVTMLVGGVLVLGAIF